MSDKLESVVLKNFGPSVLKVRIPQNIVDSINQYIDEVIINKKKSEALNAGNNLVGDVTQEFNLETEFVRLALLVVPYPVRTTSSSSSDPICKDRSNESALPTSISPSIKPTKEKVSTSESDAFME